MASMIAPSGRLTSTPEHKVRMFAHSTPVKSKTRVSLVTLVAVAIKRVDHVYTLLVSHGRAFR